MLTQMSFTLLKRPRLHFLLGDSEIVLHHRREQKCRGCLFGRFLDGRIFTVIDGHMGLTRLSSGLIDIHRTCGPKDEPALDAAEPVIKDPFAGSTLADAEAEAGHFIVVENLVGLARDELDFADGGFCEVHGVVHFWEPIGRHFVSRHDPQCQERLGVIVDFPDISRAMASQSHSGP